MFTFNDQKRFYDLGWKYRPSSLSKKFYEWIVDLIRESVKSGKLLDVGCGEGLLLKEAEKYYETYGVDISETAISKAKKICKKTKFEVVPAEKISYKNNYFNVITCLGSLEHFMNPDFVLKKFVKVLKKDGIAIIVLPNRWHLLDFIYRGLLHGEDQTHGQQLERFYSKVGGKELLEKNGLKVISIKKYNKEDASIPKSWNFVPFNLLLKLIWKIFRTSIPLNISYQFCYICRK